MTTRALVRVATISTRRVAGERAGLVVVAVFYVMVTAVLAGLWAVAADANGGSIVGYSSVALVWYVAATEAGTIALPSKLIEEIGDEIGSERVATEMLRPVSVLWMRVAGQVGTMVPRLAVCVSVGVVFASLIGGAPPRPATLPYAAIALVVGVVVNLVAQHAFAAATFWVRDAKSAWFIYQKLVFVVGGMLLPLEVLPDAVETVAKVLPFMAMAYVPGRLAAGFPEPELILVQLGWLAVLAVVATRIFAAGERRLTGAVS